MYSAMARRRMENNLQQLMCEVERLNVFRLLVEEVADGLCVLSPDGAATVLFTNASFSDYLRIPPQAVLGRCVVCLCGCFSSQWLVVVHMPPESTRTNCWVVAPYSIPNTSSHPPPHSSLWTLMPPEDKPAVLQAIHALVEEGEDRTRVSCSIQCNYPYELLPMDISMRYGTQGILMSMRPLHAPVPATPGATGGGSAAVGAEGQQAAAPTERI